VLVDDGLSKAVGDDSAGADGQRSLAGIVDLAVEGGGTKDGGDLVDGSLQVTVVTGDGLVPSNGDWDSSVGSNNVGLNGGGDGLVGDLMGGGDHMGDSVRVAKVAKTGVGVASSERIAGVDNRGSSSLLGLPLAVVVTIAVVAVGGDGDGVLVDDGLSKAVGDDSAGANGQRTLAGVVDLGVEGGGTKDGGDLMNGSLKVTVVTGDGLVASNSDWDSSVGRNNIGLNSGGDSLVGDLMCGGHDMGDGVRVAKVAETGVGVASSERIAGVHNRGSSSLLGLPLAVVVTTEQAVGGNGDGVLVDDGLAGGVSDDGAGANGKGALAGLVGLGVEGRGREEGRDLMDGSLQLTIVTGDGLVASNSHWDWEVGGNNIGLNSGGDGLVGDLMGGGHHMGDSIGEAEVAKTSGIGETAIDKGGVCPGSHCQQEGYSKNLHYSSVVFPD